MKTSITKRLFIVILLVVLGTCLLILLSNTLLLSPLYYSSVKNAMVAAADAVSGIDYSQDAEVWVEQIGDAVAGSFSSIVIRSGGEVLFSSSKELGLMPRPAAPDTREASDPPRTPEILRERNGAPSERNRFFFLSRDQNDWERVGEDMYLGTFSTPGSGIKMMVCLKELEDGTEIFLTQPVEPINQSIMQANLLLIGCMVVSLGLAAVIVLKVSKRFTEPVRRIQAKVEDLSTLRFDERCSIKTGDELEHLGDGINTLADKLKEALDTLMVQNARLEKDMEIQRQFFSNASHELRTPLSLIKGYADEISTGYAKDEAREMYISIITQEADKMNRLLKEMLALSRIESGNVELQYEKLDIGEQIRAFLDKYDGYITENGLEISLELAEGMTAICDAMYFEQVLANYISNAARYGDIKKRIIISTKTAGENVRVSVFNTGNHIPQDVLPDIWNGFCKADKARTRAAHDSYGLGLSVVKAIQSLIGRQFGAENVEDGVVFWFDVQRYADEP